MCVETRDQVSPSNTRHLIFFNFIFTQAFSLNLKFIRKKKKSYRRIPGTLLSLYHHSGITDVNHYTCWFLFCIIIIINIWFLGMSTQEFMFALQALYQQQLLKAFNCVFAHCFSIAIKFC